jgi:hypothetical protein
MAISTAWRFTTGSTPGIPAHTGQTALLGSDCVGSTTAQPQNIFERVANSAWTSKPIIGSYCMGISLMGLADYIADGMKLLAVFFGIFSMKG